ncbi:MAG: lipid A deacylase LpxR family protein [Planctomycetota bacterium]
MSQVAFFHPPYRWIVSAWFVLVGLSTFSATAQPGPIAATPSEAIASEFKAYSDDDPPNESSVSLTVFFENDGTFADVIDKTDRHYTSGQGFAVAWHENAGDSIARAFDLPADGTALGLTLVQQIFTPEEINAPVLDPDDRPFAGYLYLGGFWQREYQNVFDHVEIDLGVVGPSSLAEQAQEWIHDVIDDIDPDWVDQLGDEFAYNLTLRRKWRIALWGETVEGDPGVFEPQTWGLQLIPEVGVDVGNVYRRVNAGATLRYGFNLPDDFGPARLIDPGSATGKPVQGLSAYVFGRGLGRYVEWNTFIEGSNERNPSEAVSLEPFHGEIGGGFAVDWRRGPWTFNATYQLLRLSDEFEEQDVSNGFGSFALRARCDF